MQPTTPRLDFLPAASAVSDRDHNVFIAGDVCGGAGRLLMLDAVSGKALREATIADLPYDVVTDDRTHRTLIASRVGVVTLLDSRTGHIIKIVRVAGDGDTPGYISLTRGAGKAFIPVNDQVVW